ncbi:hypothetical protein PCH_Pc20g05080 [Penicillium rubens Wisconsin 54-1255]|uniref:Uncharacterized protein n=1 Tax=Penicillium rubens (strain ATCC 28089 / DSM 1075 / NRRL 1951 / Wisconsin 54-1255) TaxID=500485 RepID=B6HED2_PENRW|nr:hypothetical protein PCH_Pc20g05080 [Penicillium rubens Wisconsin 54-1255]
MGGCWTIGWFGTRCHCGPDVATMGPWSGFQRLGIRGTVRETVRGVLHILHLCQAHLQKVNCEPPIKLARPPRRVSPRPMDAKHHQDRFITEQKVSPPPTFSPEPTSPESTAPGNTDPLYPLLKRAPRLEKTNAHCVREKIPGVLHISDVLKRSPVQHPHTSLTSTDCLLFTCPHWLLEPWQPAALPPSVPLVTGESAVECPRQLFLSFQGKRKREGGEVREGGYLYDGETRQLLNWESTSTPTW